tara:strand:- start:173 stop:775 length:603 start_codon:yes stop_codon:yes gene_type:complete
MENNNYPQAKLDLSEILEYANSDVNYLDKQRILKQQLPLLQSYAKERDLHSVIKLLKSFPVNIQDEFWREFDENLGPEIGEVFQVNNNPKDEVVLPGETQEVKATKVKRKIKRTSQLHELIMKIALEMKEEIGKKPSARKLMKKIERDYLEYDEEAIIQEVTGKGINWISKYHYEQSLPWTSFAATFSRLWKNKKINTKK